MMTLPKLPARMETLPTDPRGYPIPWNVARDKDGNALFTVNDDVKRIIGLNQDLCPICGQHNDRLKWFVGGPASAFDPRGAYFDIPGHEECIEYALQVCPYLAARKYVGRIDADPQAMPDGVLLAVDMTQDPNRPKVFVEVGARGIELSGPYCRPEGREDVRYWRNGVRLTAEEGEAIVRAENLNPNQFEVGP